MDSPRLSRTAWRKSSRSGGTTNCVEVTLAWRKSSRSSGNGGQCVEVAPAARRVAVRDSKNPTGAKLAFTGHSWRGFAGGVKGGAFDQA